MNTKRNNAFQPLVYISITMIALVACRPANETEIGRSMSAADIEKRRAAIADMGFTDISQVFAVPPDLIGPIEAIAIISGQVFIGDGGIEPEVRPLPQSELLGTISANILTFAPDAKETIAARINVVFTAKKAGKNCTVLGTDRGGVFIFWNLNPDDQTGTNGHHGMLVLYGGAAIKAIIK